MTQEQIRNIIMGVAAVALVVGGIFYYQRRQTPTTNTITTPTPPPQVGEEPSPPSEGGVLAPSGGGGNAEELKAQEAVKKAKWNTAMDNARTAFGKGEYDKSIAFYNEALSYNKTDTVYSGLFVVYSAQNNIDQARIAIETAIKLNPLFTEYWKSKLAMLDEKTNVSYQDLKNIYTEGLLKVNPKTKIDLVTYFAGMAERNGEKSDAISLWEYAKNLYPANTSIYQAEVDRLNKLQ